MKWFRSMPPSTTDVKGIGFAKRGSYSCNWFNGRYIHRILRCSLCLFRQNQDQKTRTYPKTRPGCEMNGGLKESSKGPPPSLKITLRN